MHELINSNLDISVDDIRWKVTNFVKQYCDGKRRVVFTEKHCNDWLGF